MAKNTNSASRLLAVLTNVANASADISALNVWSAFFQISGTNDSRKAIEVSEHLSWLFEELENANMQMRLANYSEHLYADSFARIELAISPVQLVAAWNQNKSHLRPETLISLAYCAEILPDEESAIDPGELQSINSLVLELETNLENSALPHAVKNVIGHQIKLIKRALMRYPITGAKALREAAQAALGEIIEAKEIIKESGKSEDIGRLAAIWSRINKATDVAIKVDKLTQLSHKAWDVLSNMSL